MSEWFDNQKQNFKQYTAILVTKFVVLCDKVFFDIVLQQVEKKEV